MEAANDIINYRTKSLYFHVYDNTYAPSLRAQKLSSNLSFCRFAPIYTFLISGTTEQDQFLGVRYFIYS